MQINVNGIDTRYILSNEGGGPSLTFIHQLGGDLSIWDQLAGYFRDDYTVLRYDVRGHGQTAVSDRQCSVVDLSRDLRALLDALGVKKTHLVGMSMGGMIAQQFALDNPDRVETLTLTDTHAATPSDSRVLWEQRAAMVRNEGVGALAQATMERWLTAGFRDAHPEVVEQIREVFENTSSEGYAHACLALRDFDVSSRLKQIAVPTLTVAGRHDAGTPPAATQAIADAIRGARFELLDAAHLAPIEQSQRFTALLESFLQKLV
ncbi:3-oxoadipate enol-lactonase [Paraburkholderia phymatum]|uniref:3-oxoadipate enol-lactonase n=1 Tax=Paraburkholderia phymatum TaxID=148447 RepID=A0ACC6TT31_9BURK